NLKLRVGERLCVSSLEKILGLIFQVAKIGTFGQTALRAFRFGRHERPPFIHRPLSALSGRKKVRKMNRIRVGFYPFRGPDAPLAVNPLIPREPGNATRNSCCGASFSLPRRHSCRRLDRLFPVCYAAFVDLDDRPPKAAAGESFTSLLERRAPKSAFLSWFR